MSHFIKEWLINSTDWLYITIYQNAWFYIDYWSIVHFWSGCFLLLIFLYLKFKKTWIYLIGVLFSYEICEILLKYFWFNIFFPETIKDQLTDVFIGFLGAVFLWLFLKFRISLYFPKRKRSEHHLGSSAFSSVTIAFLLVGCGNFSNFYSFTPGYRFNWLSFLIWTTMLLILIRLWILFSKRFNKIIISGALALSFFILLFLVIETISLRLFNVEMISYKLTNPVLFEAIKGRTVILIIIPSFNILLYEWVCRISQPVLKSFI